MPIAAAGIGAGASLLGGLFGSSAADKAAQAQAQASEYATQEQTATANSALQQQYNMWATNQTNQQPWLQAGQSAIKSLSGLAQGGLPAWGSQESGVGGQWVQNPTGSFDWQSGFQAPTDVTQQNDPGYQFRMQQGQQALERSAAAQGNLLTGGTGKALQRYGQDYASNEYQNVYNRALQQYQQSYNEFQNNQSNEFNRLASVAGAGQSSATNLGNAGQAASNNISSIYGNLGNQIGQNTTNAGAARASGYVGSANALSQGITGALNQGLGGYYLSQLAGGSSPGAYSNPYGSGSGIDLSSGSEYNPWGG